VAQSHALDVHEEEGLISEAVFLLAATYPGVRGSEAASGVVEVSAALGG